MPWPITAAAAAATAVDVDGLNAASSGIRASPLAVDPIAEGDTSVRRTATENDSAGQTR